VKVVVWLSVLLAVAGCGYRPLTPGATGDLPVTLKTIAVRNLKNRSLRPAVQPALKEALIQRLAADGRLRVVDEEAAGAVLDGVIEGLADDAIAFDRRTDTARRRRISISFSFTVKGRESDTVLLRDGVVGVAYSITASGIAATGTAEEEAIRRAVADLAEQVVNRVVNGI
jgi:hypothetical protein